MALKRTKSGKFTIKTKAEAQEALQRVVEIEEQISPLMNEATALKQAATEYAVGKKLDVIQLDGVYFRQITRYNRFWIGTEEDLPAQAEMRSGVKSLQSIVKGMKMPNGKPLWQFVTKRVPDPDRISEAVGMGWVTEDEVAPAFVEKPQKPFLQKYVGDADASES